VPVCPIVEFVVLPVSPVVELGEVLTDPVALVPVCPILPVAWPAVPELAVPAPTLPAPVAWARRPVVAKCSAADGRPLVQ